MFHRGVYYTVKPFLPWRLRMAARRFFALRKRKRCEAVWPIDESAGKPPEGWPGWPDGKQFAFVITHDVEGPEGLEKVRRLAELEMELGFRSSFNFIPEGPYVVPPALRTWLWDHGFEVGVHDLHHDGKLYSSREGFAQKAQRINSYLKDWGATGYRSGFMLHNLEWHHDLDVAYDASTFDTDPFEPQPDAAGTIFPFFVPRPEAPELQSAEDQEQSGPEGPKSQVQGPKSQSGNESSHRADEVLTSDLRPLASGPGPAAQPLTPSLPHSLKSGYVELPYTLPQDSTLFLLLREKSPEIWLRKLDWVAAHGGLALVNVHPDYVRFEGERLDPRTFPVDHYRRLLESVRNRGEAKYWHALPRNVAARASAVPRRPAIRKPKRVGMITYSYYEFDTRVRRYAESLARRGDQVEVLSVAWDVRDPRDTMLNGVRVTRVARKVSFGGNLFVYLARMARFTFAAFRALSSRSLARPYDLVHVHNMPDFLVFAAAVARRRGARLILDLHDLMPELLADRTGANGHSMSFRTLCLEERLSARYADHVIISNHLWQKTINARSAAPERSSVFINYLDTDVFCPYQRTRTDDRRIIIFPGTLSPHQGVDLVVRAMPRVREAIPQAEFHIYGDGSELERLQQLIRDLGAESAVKYCGVAALEQIPQIVANADVGVVAKRADSFGNQAYSTKILEFMSQRIPVVVSRTEIDAFYFDDSLVRFFESGNIDSLAAALIDVLRDADRRSQMVERAYAYAIQNSWQTRQSDYLQLVDRLCDSRTRS